MPKVPFTQVDFTGGMDLISPIENIGPTSYEKAFNIRARDEGLEAVKSYTKDDAPKGKKQGIFAFENFILLFNSGTAWYKDILSANPVWTKIQNFAMDTTVDYIYAEAVPVSKFNYERRLIDANRIDGTKLDTNVSFTTLQINATSAGLVCQDGISQPWLVLADGTARELQKYSDWSQSGQREYVPIMTKMKYHQDILFGLAPDGVTLYRSVSGRPLDFVVNIDISGNKGGMADTTSYNVGVNGVTALNALKTGELFVGTKRTCHPIDLNFDKTIFAEPTFLNKKSFAAGIINQ